MTCLADATITNGERRTVLKYHTDRLEIIRAKIVHKPRNIQIIRDSPEIGCFAETVYFTEHPELSEIFTDGRWQWDDIFCLLAPCLLGGEVA